MRLFTLLLLLITLNVASASDLAKEKRWAEQTVDAIMDGDATWLNADGHEFLSIYMEAEEASTNGMIVVHGTGIHPNWDQVVKPIRVGMTANGWNTLSIQVPVLANDASYADYAAVYPEVPARFKAAEAFLKEQGMEKIVIVGHSQGATMSSYYVANNDSPAQALVLVGMSDRLGDSVINTLEFLAKINIPVFDLYGSADLEAVMKSVDSRKQAAAHNADYSQQMIDGADHFFVGKNDELINAINDWLK